MEKPNFYQLGKERKMLRHDVLHESGVSARTLLNTERVSDEDAREAIDTGRAFDLKGKTIVLERTSTKLERIAELTDAIHAFQKGDTEARSAYVQERHEGKESEETEQSPEDIQRQRVWSELDQLETMLADQKRVEYEETRHATHPAFHARLRSNALLEEAVQKRRTALTLHPDTKALVRMHELDTYNRELDVGKFVLTPSRREYVARIETLISQGKPIMLQGHTGTGKSELARIATRELTGKDSEVVYCNPQTRPSDIFGKQSLKETERGSTVTDVDYCPLARGVEKGSFVIFDEFNELDPRFRQVLKWLYNVRPGDTVDIPGNGKVKVADGFGFLMTANFGEKYKEKKALEPQEMRVFRDSTIRVEYPKADELYDVALSALSDTEGNVPLTKKEATETLKHFIDAIVDIQEAYATAIPKHYGEDNVFAMKGKKKRPVLQNYVLDTGMMVRLLQGFHVARIKYGTSLHTFIERALANTFEVEEIDEDRKLARFVFAKHGFLGGEATSRALGLDYSDGILDPRIFPRLPEETIDPTESQATLALRTVATLDPYEKRTTPIDDVRDEFDIPPPVESESTTESSHLHEAHALFNERFLGPDALHDTFGISIEQKDIPPIPFSLTELREAEKRGEMLVLNWDKDEHDNPLTIERMAMLTFQHSGKQSNVITRDVNGDPIHHLLYKEQFEDTGMVKADAWFKKDALMSKATPERGWQLVSPHIIPDSINKNYLDQTQILIDTIKQSFPHHRFPQGSDEEKAEAEWIKELPKLKALIANITDEASRRDASRAISALKVSALFREPLGNTMLRYLMMYAKGTQLFTDGKYSWSHTVDSVGSLARFGIAVAAGAYVYGRVPQDSYSNLGVVSSRRKL